MTEFENILATTGRKDEEVIAAFAVGSHVYGTATKDSDRDYLIIVKDEVEDIVQRPGIDVVVKGKYSFQEALRMGNIFSIEGVCSPTVFKTTEEYQNFRVKDAAHRRRMAHSAAERAYADYQKGVNTNNARKVYHAFRVCDYADQILEQGRIFDPGSAQRVAEIVLTEPGSLEAAFSSMFYTRYDWLLSI